MCARFTNTVKMEKLLVACGVKWSEYQFPPRYNIAPSQKVAVICDDQADGLGVAQWGLVPHGAHDAAMGSKMLLARCETLDKKPSFRNLLRRRRCLVPADGFYEWKPDENGGKAPIPVRFTLSHGQPFYFAGIWNEWEGSAGEGMRTCALITTTANELIAPMDERMPVIFELKDGGKWLDQANRAGESWRSLLQPYPAQKMRSYQVSQKVNSSKTEGPDLIREVKPAQRQMELPGLFS